MVYAPASPRSERWKPSSSRTASSGRCGRALRSLFLLVLVALAFAVCGLLRALGTRGEAVRPRPSRQ